jgi:DNA invertase Pin-like site-specific DNA recombinase
MTRPAASPDPKVTGRHLARTAYLYVRQSTLRQVVENTESAVRQYALRQRALALGWPADRVVVIDCDQGQSGARAADRAGFQRLVAEVGLGHAGIVLGLEVSRLARSSTDWHRLLELCALGGTLLLDEDGLYDPGQFNDRLLLGLKGTMSEAELHVLRARLLGGIRSKARRGELRTPLPVGLVYDPLGRVALDPDQAVQQALRLLFRTFRRTGSAWATVRAFRQQELRFPRRLRAGPRQGELVWGPLLHGRALQVLKNPRYAGAFCFGRTQTRPTAAGRARVTARPRDAWLALVREAHPGYLTWAEFEANGRRLRANAQAFGAERRAGPPREGPALLQGLVVCGRCGERMTVRYHTDRGGQIVPEYVCQQARVARTDPVCQRVLGGALDAALGDLLVEALTPRALQVTLAVQRELQARTAEADRLRRQRVERAQHEADLAEQRFLRVHPANRLVADVLEAEWNARLRDLADARAVYERQRAADGRVLDEPRQAELLALATDVPRLWRDPRTPARDRKRLVRLLVADVTLLRSDRLTAHVRFPGGATRTLTLPLARSAWQLRQTDPAAVRAADRLLDAHTDGETAARLTAAGYRPGQSPAFTGRLVANLRRAYGLPSRYARLRGAGLLTADEVARQLDVSPATVKLWGRRGLLRARRYDDHGSRLYEPPGQAAPVKWQRKFAPQPNGQTPTDSVR